MATNVFFDWAASASRFIDFDVPTAADLNAPLDQVTTGFDAVEVRIDAIDADLAGLSSPVQTQLNLKAPLASPALTGTPTAPTAAAGTATTQIATTAFVDAIAFTTATGLTAASQAEMEAGTEAGQRAMSPLRVAQAIAAQTDMVYEARSSNTVFAAADKDKFIEYTGSFTQTFGSAASLGANWKVVLKNAYTDSVYLTPSGGATIDGVADFLMYPGEARLLQCDGTNFHSVVLQPFVATYTASGFFFKPPGYKHFGGLLWGGGGSGAKTSGSNSASGGGGGACAPFVLASTSLAASETVTIGAGGAAVSAANTSGNAGGNSTFGALLTSYGGGAGFQDGAASNLSGGGGGGVFGAGPIGSGSAVSGGQPQVASGYSNPGYGGGGSSAGGPGLDAVYGGGGGGGGHSVISPGVGGRSYFGGGGGGATGSGAAVSAGGASLFGGAGGAAVLAASGVAGTAPAGGGGATITGTASGAGARGELRIWGIV
jgi:hypothetical protein